MSQRSLQRLNAQLDELDGWIAGGEGVLAARAPSISGWCVGEQVDHSLQVMTIYLARVSEPGVIAGRINLTGRLVLATGWFPRGVGKSPKGVLPKTTDPVELAAAVAVARAFLVRVEAAPEKFAFRRPISRHPIFGELDAPQSLRFAVVHTHHHLKIVRELHAAVAPDR